MYRPTCFAATALPPYVLCGERGAWGPGISVRLVYRASNPIVLLLIGDLYTSKLPTVESLGLCSSMGGKQPSPCMRPAGLSVRLVALRRWKPECCLPGLLFHITIKSLRQQRIIICH